MAKVKNRLDKIRDSRKKATKARAKKAKGAVKAVTGTVGAVAGAAKSAVGAVEDEIARSRRQGKKVNEILFGGKKTMPRKTGRNAPKAKKSTVKKSRAKK